MVNLVKLVFECTIECDYQYSEEIGKDIAHDLLNEWDNGEDILEWKFVKSEVVIDDER